MSPAALSTEDAVALLRWYAQMGVDIAIGDEAVDRFAESRAPARISAPRQLPAEPASSRQSIPVPATPRLAPQAPALHTAAPEAVAVAAREIAAAATSLAELRAGLEAFEGCALKNTATRLVFSDGAEDAPVMFIGEAPGREEDQQGKPFVGRSGQLLDRMLAAIGLDRTRAYIANAVPWRPPGNRDPTPQELTICRPFIERQIELVNPRLMVCLGARSANAILGVNEGIMKLRGRWLSYDIAGRPCRAMATLHPAFLLRSPLQKRLAWRDFRAIATELAGSSN